MARIIPTFICALALLGVQFSFAETGTSNTVKKFRPNVTKVQLNPVTLSSKGEVAVDVEILFPEGYHLNEKAPSDVVISDGTQVIASDVVRKASFKLPFTLMANPDQREFLLESTLYYCKETGASVCLIKSYAFELPVVVSAGGEMATKISISVPPESLKTAS